MSWEILRQLAEFRAGQGCAISVYVDADPSLRRPPATPGRRVNLAGRGTRAHHATGAASTCRRPARGPAGRLGADPAVVRNGLRPWTAPGGRRLLLRPRQPPGTLRLPRLGGRRCPSGKGAAPDASVPLVGGTATRDRRRRLARAGPPSTGCKPAASREVADLSEDTPGQHDQGGWSQTRFERHIEKP